MLCLCAACFASLRFAWYVLGLQSEGYSGIWLWMNESNFRFYAVMLLVFFSVFFGIRIVCILFERTENSTMQYVMSYYEQAAIAALPVIILLYSLDRWFWIEFVDEFPYTASGRAVFTVPSSLMRLVFLAGIVLTFYMLLKEREISTFSLYFVYVMCIVLCFYGTYYVNLFKIDMHHAVAVIESIYNVCDLIPYTKITSGIYGHYGLFFLLPVRLSNGSPYVIAALIAAAGCMTVAASYYVCHTILSKNWLRAAAACAGVYEAAVHRGAGPYWQVFPIRELFPMLLCAYVCWLVRHKKKLWETKWMCIGYLLVSLAILWNTESGIFCLLAFSAAVITQRLQVHQWYERKQLLFLGKLAFYSAASLLFSIAVVNAYNLLCGGKLIFRAFFIPLFTKGYMDGTLRYDLPWGNHAWVYVFCLFAALTAWGLYHTRLFQKGGEVMSPDAPAAVVIAVLGLLSFSYYVNRAAYSNLTICFGEAVCANALLIEKTWPSLKRWRREVSLEELGKRSVAVVSLVIVASLGVQLTLSAANMVNESHSPQVLTTKGIEPELTDLASRVPENVYGAGSGISILYHMLGWDNYAHVRDFSDLFLGGGEMGEDTVNVIVEEILQQDGFLLSGVMHHQYILEKVFLQDPSFYLAETFTIQDKPFYYYKK